jgi:hypothetical protein
MAIRYGHKHVIIWLERHSSAASAGMRTAIVEQLDRLAPR